MGYADRVKDTTTTTGTGTITITGTPPTGYQAFASAFAVGDAVCYCMTDGSSWEVGEGTLTSATTISRDIVLRSSNSNSLVNWGAGSKDVFVTLAADNIADSGVVAAMQNVTILF